MNRNRIAQELVRIARELMARYPSDYFVNPGAESRAQRYGLMDVENEDMTGLGLAAKMLEWQESEGGR